MNDTMYLEQHQDYTTVLRDLNQELNPPPTEAELTCQFDNHQESFSMWDTD